MTPIAEIEELAGPASNAYVSVFAGISASDAVFVTTSMVSSAMVRLLCVGRTGAVLEAVTMTVKLFVALSGGVPSSVTTVVIRFVVWPCAIEGAQVITKAAEIFALVTEPADESTDKV